MPGRTAKQDQIVSAGMGARLDYRYPDGTDISQARAELRVHDLAAPTSPSLWWVSNTQDAITIAPGPPPVVEIRITSQSADRFGRVYQDVVPPGRYGWALDLWLGGQADPDYRIQGVWVNEEASGEKLPECNAVASSTQIRFSDLTVSLQLPGAVVFTGPVTGMQKLADDANPILGGALKTAANQIIFDDDGAVTTEYGRCVGDATGLHITAFAGLTAELLSDTRLNLRGGPTVFRWPQSDGPAGTVMGTDGSGNLSLIVAQLMYDTAPDLGGTLRTQGNPVQITTAASALVGQISDDTGNLSITAVGGTTDFEIVGTRDLALSAARDLKVGGLKVPAGTGTAGDCLVDTDGAGTVGFAARLVSVAGDTSPTLGGPLDTAGNAITGAASFTGPSFAVSNLATFNDRVDIGTRGQISDDGASFKLAAPLGNLVIGAGVDLRWPTSAGNPGDVMTLHTDGSSLVMQAPAPSGLQSVQEDTDPGLGGSLRTLGHALLGFGGAGVIFNSGLDSLTFPASRGTVGQFPVLGADGVIGWSDGTGTGLNAVVDDPNPALGGALNTSGQVIYNSAGAVIINQAANSLQLPTTRGTVGHFMQQAANGDVVWAAAAGSGGLTKIEDDSDPTLGSVLHTNSFAIELGAKATPIGSLATATNTITLGNSVVAGGEVLLEQAQSGSPKQISLKADGNLVIDAGGAAIAWPAAVGNDQDCMIYNSISGQLSFSPRIASVQQDPAPVLGGNLDVSGNQIVGAVVLGGSSLTCNSTARFNSDLDLGDTGQLKDTGSALQIAALGGGDIELNAGAPHKWPKVAGIVGQSLVLASSGQIGFEGRLASLSQDTNPTLGGTLSVGAFAIDGAVTFTGTSFTVAQGATFNNGLSLGASGKLSDSAGNLLVQSLAAGKLVLDGGGGAADTWFEVPANRGTAGQVWTTNADGTTDWTTAAGGLSEVKDDTSPQLGGALDSNGFAFEVRTGASALIGQLAQAAGNLVLFSEPANPIQVVAGTFLTLEGTTTTLRSQTGDLRLNAGVDLKWPTADGEAGAAVVSDGAGQLRVERVSVKGGAIDITEIPQSIKDSLSIEDMSYQGETDPTAMSNNTNTLNQLLKQDWPLQARTGVYNFGGAVDVTTEALIRIDHQSAPKILGLGRAGNYSGSAFARMPVFVYNGPAEKKFFALADEGAVLENILLYCKPIGGTAAQRAAIGVHCAKWSGVGIGGPGKAKITGCVIQEADIAAQAGDPGLDQNGDHITLQYSRLKDCRIGFQSTRTQNVHFLLQEVQFAQLEEVALNCIGGGKYHLDSCTNQSSNGIFLRIEGRAGGTGSANGWFDIAHMSQDGGNAANCVWLDGRVTAGDHWVRFNHCGFAQGQTNYARIRGFGKLQFDHCAKVDTFNGRIYMQGNSAAANAALTHVASQLVATPANLMAAGNGYNYQRGTLCYSGDSDIVADFSDTSTSGSPATNQAAWDAIVDARYDSSTDAFGVGGGAYV